MIRKLIVVLLVLGGCSQEAEVAESVAEPAASPEPLVEQASGRNAYFGDLHIHTKYSFDAYIFGTRATPDDAYEFAKGGSLTHPAGIEMKLKAPLDFIAVSDHATYLGMFEKMDDLGSSVADHPLSIALRAATTPEERNAVFQEILPRERGFVDEDDLLDLNIVRGAWSVIVEAAERHNDPGTLTTFIGYEFTAGGRRGENLHRNVIFRGSAAPDIPYSRIDADNNPENLWEWMDIARGNGMESLAIPHNSNGSDGWMFELTNKAKEPIDAAYAERRMRNEPLVEVTQVKGTSDTHPLLSPNDEWANFELMESTIGSSFPSQPQGSYVREAYLNGLAMQAESGFNPYRFGLIGSSDTHNAAGSFKEDDYWSKTGLLDATPALRGTIPDADGNYADTVRQYWGASGLAAVWAESNTRDSIFDAFRRKETFATSGPRMRLRFFAGRDLSDDDFADMDAVYAKGVPMGGDLTALAAASTFLVWATQDPEVVPLDRVQIIKGWVEDGAAREEVFDVVCSNGSPDANHRCPDNGASVDLETCAATGSGAAELQTTWSDPRFDASQHAFYYVRALQNPTCRWSTWDALRNGMAPKPSLPATIQDRAWSSPIWYIP